MATKPITANKEELLDIERGFWTGDSAYYEANADTECLVAFPQMAKAMTNAQLAETASKPNRWRDLDIKLKGMIEPGSDIVMLTYDARATRVADADARWYAASDYDALGLPAPVRKLLMQLEETR